VHRLLVAHLADEDDVRVLAQDAAQRALERAGVLPTSRWLMIDFLSRCRNSIGSSIVTMCLDPVSFISSIIAASVVDLPEPVVPVTRMIPRSSWASSLMTGGRLSSSIVRMLNGIERQTTEIEPRWWKALTRKRPTLSIV
jgi:hypothetical protein